MFKVMEFDHGIHGIRMASGSGPVARKVGIQEPESRNQEERQCLVSCVLCLVSGKTAQCPTVSLRGTSSWARVTWQSQTSRSLRMESAHDNRKYYASLLGSWFLDFGPFTFEI